MNEKLTKTQEKVLELFIAFEAMGCEWVSRRYIRCPQSTFNALIRKGKIEAGPQIFQWRAILDYSKAIGPELPPIDPDKARFTEKLHELLANGERVFGTDDDGVIRIAPEVVSEFEIGDVVKVDDSDELWVVCQTECINHLSQQYIGIYLLSDKWPWSPQYVPVSTLTLYKRGDEFDAELLRYFEARWEDVSIHDLKIGDRIRVGGTRGRVIKVQTDETFSHSRRQTEVTMTTPDGTHTFHSVYVHTVKRLLPHEDAMKAGE